MIAEEMEEGVRVITRLPRKEVEEALGLHHDLEEVFGGFPGDERIERARQEFRGLRIVQDDFFPCLVSYLMSPQMRIPRIKEMYNTLAREFGETVDFHGEQLLKFPDRETLSNVSEQQLRDLGIGYRARYISESVEILEEFDHSTVDTMEYVKAREEMKRLYGVGDKVADCVLLFSKGFTEASPLDTWAKKALRSEFPELHSEDYSEASENLRNRFGEHAGYATEYIFHAARQGVIEVEE